MIVKETDMEAEVTPGLTKAETFGSRKAAYAKTDDENVIICESSKSGAVRPVPKGSGDFTKTHPNFWLCTHTLSFSG
jgi:hypothetical protein